MTEETLQKVSENRRRKAEAQKDIERLEDIRSDFEKLRAASFVGVDGDIISVSYNAGEIYRALKRVYDNLQMHCNTDTLASICCAMSHEAIKHIDIMKPWYEGRIKQLDEELAEL